MLHAVIMAGGAGTRFWPLSRRALPKQFLKLTGERSLIQMAFDRCRPLVPADRCWVVTSDRLAEETAAHLPEVPRSRILCEPCGRNTAPCIGLAAVRLLAADAEGTMLVMPADHVIDPVPEFVAAVERASAVVKDDPSRMVLFGVPPTSPATGFGYVQRGKLRSPDAYDVSSFREKPDLPTADEYVRAGTFYWNCGIFVWKAATILDAIRGSEPELGALLDELGRHAGRATWDEAVRELFPGMKSISIDYAVLERTPGLVVVEARFGWDDVGSWEGLSRHEPPDGSGNVVIGRHCGIRTSECIIHSSPGHLVATVGIENCIIVQTPDATLIADRSDENALRELHERLKEQGYDHLL